MTEFGWSKSYRKYILQITQPSQYRYAKLQYRFAVISGSPSKNSITSWWSLASRSGEVWALDCPLAFNPPEYVSHLAPDVPWRLAHLNGLHPYFTGWSVNRITIPSAFHCRIWGSTIKPTHTSLQYVRVCHANWLELAWWADRNIPTLGFVRVHQLQIWWQQPNRSNFCPNFVGVF